MISHEAPAVESACEPGQLGAVGVGGGGRVLGALPRRRLKTKGHEEWGRWQPVTLTKGELNPWGLVPRRAGSPSRS